MIQGWRNSRKGSSLAHNARKKAGYPEVKARMAELAAPAQQKAEHEIAITIGAAEEKLWEIASVDLGKGAVKVPEQIAAIKTLAQLRGWNANRAVSMRVSATDWVDGGWTMLRCLRSMPARVVCHECHLSLTPCGP